MLALVERLQANPYEVLGVEPDVEQNEIKTAYRRLALEYHPDRNPGNLEAEERFKELSNAYATLRDPDSRNNYDRNGTSKSTGSFQPADWRVIFQEADLRINWDVRDEVPRTGNAMFDFLFGAIAGAMQASGLMPGQNRHKEVIVPLAFARTGGLHRVRLPGPSICPVCRGTGLEGQVVCQRCGGRRQLASAEVDLAVPSGVRDGTKLRLKGLGGIGSPPGDAIFTIHVSLPKGAKRVGNDLHAEFFVTPLEASRGLRGQCMEAMISVPQGVQDGQVLIFGSKGISGGNLVVTIRFHVWLGLFRSFKDRFQMLSST
jgi:molecular chaperone DnaJ